MTKIVVNHELRKQLYDLKQPLELYTETGQIIGHFIPKRPWEPEWTEEEMREVMAGPDYSTDEVLKHLESL